MKDNRLWLGALTLKGVTKIWEAKFHQPQLLSNRRVWLEQFSKSGKSVSSDCHSLPIQNFLMMFVLQIMFCTENYALSLCTGKVLPSYTGERRICAIGNKSQLPSHGNKILLLSLNFYFQFWSPLRHVNSYSSYPFQH